MDEGCFYPCEIRNRKFEGRYKTPPVTKPHKQNIYGQVNDYIEQLNDCIKVLENKEK